MGVIVLQGSCPRGSCPQGSCPRGSCPRGSCPVTLMVPYDWANCIYISIVPTLSEQKPFQMCLPEVGVQDFLSNFFFVITHTLT